MGMWNDLTGRTFGLLEVLRFHSTKTSPAGRNVTLWLCRCSCGAPERAIRYDCLIRGKTKSCGCVRRAVAAGLPLPGRGRVMTDGRIVRLPVYHSKEWHRHVWNAKQRGIGWSLPLATFSELILSPCHYCGEVPAPFNGIGRKDDGGFSEENSVPCCRVCRRLRRKLGHSEFLAHAKRIAHFQSVQSSPEAESISSST